MADKKANQFWLEKWEESKIGFHDLKPHELLVRFWGSLELPSNSHVLVPLCGKSKDMIWLKDAGYDVVGVELSETAILSFFEENQITCRRKYDRHNREYVSPNLTIWKADIFDLPDLNFELFSVVYDRAALIALSYSQRKAYAEILTKNMPVRSNMFLIGLEYETSLLQGPPYSVGKDDITILYGDSWAIEEIVHHNTKVKNISGVETLYKLEKVRDYARER